jgi:hypothetical protein
MVSKSGKINIAIAIAGLDLKGNPAGGVSKLNSIKLMVRMARISPIISEPVSPIKIFAGAKLYTKNASKNLW